MVLFGNVCGCTVPALLHGAYGPVGWLSQLVLSVGEVSQRVAGCGDAYADEFDNRPKVATVLISPIDPSVDQMGMSDQRVMESEREWKIASLTACSNSARPLKWVGNRPPKFKHTCCTVAWKAATWSAWGAENRMGAAKLPLLEDAAITGFLHGHMGAYEGMGAWGLGRINIKGRSQQNPNRPPHASCTSCAPSTACVHASHAPHPPHAPMRPPGDDIQCASPPLEQLAQFMRLLHTCTQQERRVVCKWCPVVQPSNPHLISRAWP